jgi:nuclear pore complex protein Nup107
LVLRRPAADSAYHVSQLHIITNRLGPLLQGFAQGLQQGLYPPDGPDYAGMTRFFAHLCLFLQLIDVDVEPTATQIVLEAYLQVLEVRRRVPA